MNKTYLLLLLGVLLAVSSCNNAQQKTSETTEVDEYMVTFSTMYGSAGSVHTVAELFLKSGIEHNASITLDTAILPAYVKTEETKAIMTGVFSADALYHSAFGESQKSFESYTSAQYLANTLGIGPFYVENLLKKEDNGLNEKDSVLYKFDEVLSGFDTTFTQEKRFKIIASYIIGNIIEKLYLIDKSVTALSGTPMNELTEQDKFIFDLLKSEGESVDLFLELLDKYAGPKSSELKIELTALSSLYKELVEKGVPDIEPGDTFEPTEEMKNISAQIIQSRNTLVGIQ